MLKELRIFFLLMLLTLVPRITLAANYEVIIDENGLNPVSLVIDKGDTVRWINNGTSSHSVTSGYGGVANGLFDSGLIAPGESFEHTFELPVYIGYFDRSDSSSVGVVQVRGVSISPGNSILVSNSGFNLMLIINNQMTHPSYEYTITVDENQVYKGNYFDLVNRPFVTGQSYIAVAQALSISVTSPLPLGVHAVKFDVTTPDGKILASDIVTYTVLEVLPPPPPPVAGNNE